MNKLDGDELGASILFAVVIILILGLFTGCSTPKGCTEVWNNPESKLICVMVP